MTEVCYRKEASPVTREKHSTGVPFCTTLGLFQAAVKCLSGTESRPECAITYSFRFGFRWRREASAGPGPRLLVRLGLQAPFLFIEEQHPRLYDLCPTSTVP